MSEARTWKCPECGHTEEIGYDWLAEHGGPVCGQCDCDMELQPEADATADEHASVVERLAEKADASGLKAEDLDDVVHELAASIAADINNNGLEDQIRYLVGGIGAQHTERQIDDLIADHANPTEEEE
jgi:hypothetical protein